MHAIDDLNNISITTLDENQGLFFNNTKNVWENKTLLGDQRIGGRLNPGNLTSGSPGYLKPEHYTILYGTSPIPEDIVLTENFYDITINSTKNENNPYYNIGTSESFVINGVEITGNDPITLYKGNKYVFTADSFYIQHLENGGSYNGSDLVQGFTSTYASTGNVFVYQIPL